MTVLTNAIAKSRMNMMTLFFLLVIHGNAFSQVNSSPIRSSESGNISQSKTVSTGVQDRRQAEKDFSGTWQLKETPTETNQRLKSIEAATAKLNRLIRGIARDKMKKKTTPPKELKIADAGGLVKLSKNGLEVAAEVDGKPVEATIDGRTGTMQVGKRDGKLIVVIKANEVTNTVVYELSKDGKNLRQQTEIKSSKLAAPIRFTSYFHR